MKKNRQTNKKGFILVEMLVAVFLFTIVMLVSMTAVLALIDTNKKNQNTKSAVNNLTLVINSIVKSLAVSEGYYCGIALPGYNGTVGQDCNSSTTPTEGTAITFRTPINSAGSPAQTVRYKWVETNGNGQILRSINDTSDANNIPPYIPITSPEIDVGTLNFYVYDTDKLIPTPCGTCNVKQPRVVMIVKGTTGTKDNIKTHFNIQTTVSQRKLDATF